MKSQEKSEQYLSKYLLAHFQKLENLQRDLARLPTEKEFFFLHTAKQFNAFTFVAFVVAQEPIKHMYACTYSVSRKVVDAFVELYDKGLVESMTLMISDSMLQRNPSTMDYLKALAASRGGIKVQFAWSHAKVTLIQTHNAYYVVEGSGNWSDNASIEQYLFARDSDLYRFRESMFTDIEIRHEF